jgi:hypothetical protein
MSRNHRGSPITGILERTIRPDASDLTPEQARAFLKWKFAKVDLERADTLSAKARVGTLTPDEKQELDLYLVLDAVLSIAQSKARMCLKTAGLGA